MKFQTKRGVIIFLENFILPLHKGVTHYAKLTLAQKQFILKDLHEEQKKQLKNPIIYSAPPPQGQMQNITQKTQQFSNLQKVSNNNFNRSYNLNSNNNNNSNNNSDIMQIIQDNKFNRHQFVSNSLKNHPTLQILSDYEYKVLKEHEEKQKNQRQKKQKKNNVKENQPWIYKDEDLPSYQVIGIIKQPHNPMQNLSNQSDKFANFQDNQYYYNIGTKINLVKTEQSIMKFEIKPQNFSPFVKIKKIQKNDFFKQVKENNNVPISLDNHLKPYNCISIDELDFIIFDGYKLFMCEYEELSLTRTTFQYIYENRKMIQYKLEYIARKIQFNLEEFLNYWQKIRSKIAASEKQILKPQIQQEYEIQLDSDFIKQILTDKNFDSQQFKYQYETVLEIYQQIFALMNHFDQKFFFRSKSLEWAEKKYQFLTCGPEEQIKLLEKLSKALKI